MLLDASVRDLSRIFGKEIGAIREVARKVISRGFPLNQDATCESYYNYVLEQLRSERISTQRHVLSDRSLVDLLAYIRTNNTPTIPVFFVNMVEEIVHVESKYFDLYCYLPIEFPLVVDNVRPGDEEYRKSVDNSIKKILYEYNLNTVEITGSVEARTQKIIELIK